MPSDHELAQLRISARDHGMLWRISEDGRVSYLYGTIHLGRREWLHPGPRISAAFKATDVVAFELDITNAATLNAVANAPPSRVPIPLDIKARLERQLAAECINPQAASVMHPVLLLTGVSLLAARRDGCDPAYAQEIALARFARSNARPIVALERLAQQLALIVPTREQDVVPAITQLLASIENPATRRALVRLSTAWSSGDVAEIENYPDWCACGPPAQVRQQTKLFNDDRNPPMAEGIDRLHGDDKRVFAAVGALHMTGDKDLPLLMQQRGYTVERVRLD